MRRIIIGAVAMATLAMGMWAATSKGKPAPPPTNPGGPSGCSNQLPLC